MRYIITFLHFPIRVSGIEESRAPHKSGLLITYGINDKYKLPTVREAEQNIVFAQGPLEASCGVQELKLVSSW